MRKSMGSGAIVVAFALSLHSFAAASAQVAMPGPGPVVAPSTPAKPLSTSATVAAVPTVELTIVYTRTTAIFLEFYTTPKKILSCSPTTGPAGKNSWAVTCRASVPKGSTVTVTAKRQGLGGTFSVVLPADWAGQCDSMNASVCAIVMNKPRTLVIK